MTYDSRTATKDLDELRAAITDMRAVTIKVAEAIARKLKENPSIKAPAQERRFVIQTLENIEHGFRSAADDVQAVRKAIETIGDVL